MKDKPSIPDRLRADSTGLGEAAESDIERRAAELAMIDGRDASPTPISPRRAWNSRAASGTPVAPEVTTPLVSEITAWDESLDEHGHQSDRAASLDEASIPELLIQEGIAEANHDRRVARRNRPPPTRSKTTHFSRRGV